MQKASLNHHSFHLIILIIIQHKGSIKLLYLLKKNKIIKI